MAHLTPEQLKSFDENGYIVVENVIDRASVLDPLVDEYEALLHRLVAGWIGEGRLAPGVQDLEFGEKLVAAHEAGCDFFQLMDISLPLGNIEPDTPLHTGPAAFGLLVDDGLLDAAESIVGPEVTSVPIQHVRFKPRETRLHGEEIRPHLIATRLHQDRAVAREEADATHTVTTWVAVTDADEENGCLVVVPGSHKGDMLTHCPLPQVGIPDSLIDPADIRPVPVPAGGVLMFHPMTIHGSLPNRSDRLRWSFDLRYCRTGDPTGRPQFPDFVARSASNPGSAFRDAGEWARMWDAARRRLAQTEDEGYFHRWSADAPVCA